MDNPLISSGFKIGNFNLIGAWFGTALTAWSFSLIFLIYISSLQMITPKEHSYRLYQALPNTQIAVSDSISTGDGRGKIVEDFFKARDSELAQYASLFIKVADKYQLDFRLLPAIAMQESNGGKRMPEESFNPFGYGIYGAKLIKFNSFEEAIEKVGKSIREDYLNERLTTPYEIMSKYTPPSVEKGGPWAINVSQFMAEQR